VYCRSESAERSPSKTTLLTDPGLPSYLERSENTPPGTKTHAGMLIEDVTLLKEQQITLQVRFKGGATTTLRVPLPLNAWQGRKTPEHIVALIDELLDHHTDAEVAELLNERACVTGAGEKFSKESVRWIRYSHVKDFSSGGLNEIEIPEIEYKV
jgi:hypothetical protein